jgi:hypothetical protein
MKARITEVFETCQEAWDLVRNLQAKGVECGNPHLIVPGHLFPGSETVQPFYTVVFVADPTLH